MTEIPKVDLQPFIDRLSNVGFKNVHETDGHYFDCAGTIYDTYEFLTEPPAKNTSPDTAIDILAFVEKFEPSSVIQLSPVR